MNEQSVDVPILSCEALVVGGGIAGCWTALKLAERGIDTLLVFYQGADRGGRLGSTNLSVGAISTAPILRSDYAAWLDELGRGQVQSSVVQFTVEYLQDEIEALKKFDPLKKIELGVALASGSGKRLIEELLVYLESKGVRVMTDVWITRIDANESQCRGVQYQQGNVIGAIRAGSMVLTSGGYSGLFHGAVKTGTYGSIHARFLLAGGKLSNLEFIFKHGYGQPDLGKLTPTEELPGVEIYDQDGVHVQWLEEELFYGRGTHNHFQAFMTWRKDENKKYFVDFRFCNFHRSMKAFLGKHKLNSQVDRADCDKQFENFVSSEKLSNFYEFISNIIKNNSEYTFSDFNRIKPWLKENCSEDKHRIRQIAYFSMGGIMHHGFLTNLKNVFVNGEAMHDYGAHRVGGLPWALYLCAARKIADDIASLKLRNEIQLHDVDVIPQLSSFDPALLEDIQLKLFEFQERGRDERLLFKFLQWLQVERKSLCDQNKTLDDGYAYLLLAEAIVKSSIARRESRGCFFRSDFMREDYRLNRTRTIAAYNAHADSVVVDSVDKSHILDLVFNRSAERGRIHKSKEKNNASYFLLKKHIGTEKGQFVAVETDFEFLTYEALNQLVDQYAFFLFSQGMIKGDRVAIHLRDSQHWIALFLACLQLGIVAVPLNTYAKEHDILFYIEDCQASLLISEQSLLVNLNFEVLSDRTATTIISLEDILPLQDERISGCVPVDETTVGFILYTSGTTGKPKGAIHTHADLEFTALGFAEKNLNPTIGDKFYSSSRLYFAYGLGNSLTFPLYFGCTTRLSLNKLSPFQTLQVLNDSSVTHFFSIPAIYSSLFLEINEVNIPVDLKLCVSAGEPLSENLARKWVDKIQRPMIDGIGSTEALHIFCCNYYSVNGVSRFGVVVDGYELRLLDDNNFLINKKNVPANLAVSGGSLALGYWNNPEATKSVFINNLLLTGDRYLINDNNEYIYLGRNGDLYKVSGLWVSALEIESVLKDFDYLQDAALVVFLNSQGEQKTAAFIVPSALYLASNARNSADRFIEQLSSRVMAQLEFSISKYKLPDYLIVIRELPRTSTGKVHKSQLKDQAVQYDIKKVPAFNDGSLIRDTEAV